MNEASRWRIDVARRLAQPYADQPGVQTIVLAGSAAKGLADDYSDLDVVVVWDDPDVGFLDTAPLPGGERFTDLAGEGGSRVEQYFVGALKVDVASMRRDALDELVDDLVVRHDPEPMKQKIGQGFTEGVTRHGPDGHGLGVLAARNRRYWSVTPEAKWSDHLLAHCPLAPPDTGARRMLELRLDPCSEPPALS